MVTDDDTFYALGIEQPSFRGVGASQGLETCPDIYTDWNYGPDIFQRDRPPRPLDQ